MAAIGYTPIILYNSTTPSSVPIVGNLQAGELALNIADGKLFFNKSGAITTLSDSSIISNLSWSSANNTLSILGTGSLLVPSGTGFNRPATPTAGMLRYNTVTGTFEGYQVVSGATIASMTNVTTTATVVTASAHNLITGNTITVTGATPSAYNGTFVITVVDTVTFTYTMLSNPGGSATVVGSYSYSAWAAIGTGTSGSGGSTAAGGAIVVNNKAASANYTITTAQNGFSVGPVTVNSGVTVTVSSGSRWVII